MSEDTPSFLNRWSRLKRRVSLEREAPTPATERPSTAPEAPVSTGEPPAPAAANPQGAPASRVAEDEAPVDLSSLPDIESLGPDSDYTVFMRKGVPDDLRVKALRRMWVTDPTISGPDLLEMNALDYTGLEGPQPLVISPPQAFAALAKAAKERLGAGGKPQPQEPDATSAPTADTSPGAEEQQVASNSPPEEKSG